MTNTEFAQGLRELAAIYESDERIAHPQRLDIALNTETPESFRNSVRALAVGGRVEKIPPSGDADYFYRVRRTLPSGLEVELWTSRYSVCRKVRKMQMVEAWECPDSILDPEAGDV